MSEDYSVRQDRQANTSFYPFVVSFEIPLPQTSHPSPNFIKQNLLGKLANPRPVRRLVRRSLGVGGSLGEGGSTINNQQYLTSLPLPHTRPQNIP
jgi:hypothetical protein